MAKRGVNHQMSAEPREEVMLELFNVNRGQYMFGVSLTKELKRSEVSLLVFIPD